MSAKSAAVAMTVLVTTLVGVSPAVLGAAELSAVGRATDVAERLFEPISGDEIICPFEPVVQRTTSSPFEYDFFLLQYDGDTTDDPRPTVALENLPRGWPDLTSSLSGRLAVAPGCRFVMSTHSNGVLLLDLESQTVERVDLGGQFHAFFPTIDGFVEARRTPGRVDIVEVLTGSVLRSFIVDGPDPVVDVAIDGHSIALHSEPLLDPDLGGMKRTLTIVEDGKPGVVSIATEVGGFEPVALSPSGDAVAYQSRRCGIDPFVSFDSIPGIAASCIAIRQLRDGSEELFRLSNGDVQQIQLRTDRELIVCGRNLYRVLDGQPKRILSPVHFTICNTIS